MHKVLKQHSFNNYITAFVISSRFQVCQLDRFFELPREKKEKMVATRETSEEKNCKYSEMISDPSILYRFVCENAIRKE